MATVDVVADPSADPGDRGPRPSTTDLVIVGAGGHGREALAVARAATRHGSARWNVLGFVDDGPVDTALIESVATTVLGPVDTLADIDAAWVVAVGDTRRRRAIVEAATTAREAAVLIDPTAWVGDDVELAPGAMLWPGSRCTTNVRIGRHTHLNCGVTVSHDCRVGDFVSLSPGVLLNGGVTVGDGAFLGSGAIVLPGLEIGAGAAIGAGAVVTTDVRPGRTVVGVPAR